MPRTPAHTIADLNAMENNPEWLGFGYLGTRRDAADNTDPEVPATDPIVIAEADMKALDDANAHGLTADQLFDWANSKYGRWYGDCMFHNDGRHAEQYLPSRFIAEVPAEEQN